MRHENLNSFIGACIDAPNISVLFMYCARGSLEVIDILEKALYKQFPTISLGCYQEQRSRFGQYVCSFIGGRSNKGIALDIFYYFL